MKQDHRQKIISIAELPRLRHHFQLAHLVATSGCFDVLHFGHMQALEQARNLGWGLVVGVNSDASVKRYKGPSRPILPEEQRVGSLACLQCVDWVVVFDEDTPAEFIRKCQPEIYVKGGDWSWETLPQVDRDAISEVGCKPVFVPRSDGLSTTNLIETIRRLA